jgi:hypothetical protein
MPAVSWFLVALAITVLSVASLLWSRVQRQRRWTPVVGAINGSSIGMSDGDFFPNVTYEYTINGRTYQGDRIVSLQITYNWRGPSRRSAARYPKGQAVTVYVDPEYPVSSVLEPGGDRAFWPFILLVSGAMLGIALLGLRST